MKPFLRARTEEQIECRKNEIVAACETVYFRGGYDAVTFKAISDLTSFTRPSIYNYYSTPGEVMLDLMARYFVDWREDVREGIASEGRVSRERFCDILADTMVRNDRLFRLWTDLNLIEGGSAVGRIAEFERSFHELVEAIVGFASECFPKTGDGDLERFSKALIIMLHGYHQFNHPSEKQMEAMEACGIPTGRDPRGCARDILMLITSGFEGRPRPLGRSPRTGCRKACCRSPPRLGAPRACPARRCSPPSRRVLGPSRVSWTGDGR